ncbi:MAG: hypothetical protein EBU90_14590 [Proteobacteria bacterium]|nr:hypothetical protein [Pseudomonadota bacterium]NBP15680.1 hypothetical protein [bacterium]
MYYTVEYKDKNYMIKVKYNEYLQEYIISDGYVHSSGRNLTEEEKIQIEQSMPEVIYEIGYAEDIFNGFFGEV